jgi:RNA polymerase sigma-70 factor (ECF subfamily)
MGDREEEPEEIGLARRIARAHDREAEAQLCRLLFPRVRAYGLLHLRDASAAADLAQDVLVVVLRALREGRVEAPERVLAYVMGVCRNTVLDFRKGERRRQSLLEYYGPSLASEFVSSAVTLDADRLEQCLQHLCARDRVILVLSYFAERSGPEVAAELEMSTGSVRVARHRALKQLHECMTGSP